MPSTITDTELIALAQICKNPSRPEQLDAKTRSLMPELQNKGLVWLKCGCWTASDTAFDLVAAHEPKSSSERATVARAERKIDK